MHTHVAQFNIKKVQRDREKKKTSQRKIFFLSPTDFF